MYNDIVGWFTTEDGVHVPIRQGQSKTQAIKSHFSTDINNSKYQENKKEIHKILNAGEARGIDSLTKKNNPDKFNEMVNWVDRASGTHNIETTKKVIDDYLR